MSLVALAILALVLLVGIGVAGFIRAHPRGREGTEPTCGRCGYNLTGSLSIRCPECGVMFIEAGVILGKLPPKRRWLGLVSLVVLSILFVGGLGVVRSQRAAQRAQAQARLRAFSAQAASAQAQQQKSSQQAETDENAEP